MRNRETPEARPMKQIPELKQPGRFECFACGTIFKAGNEATYLAYDPNSAAHWPKDVYMVADCPVCGAQIRMGKRLPKLWNAKGYDYGETWETDQTDRD